MPNKMTLKDVKNSANHGTLEDGRHYSEITLQAVANVGESFDALDKILYEHLPYRDPDEGMPLWDYVRKVSRELYNDAVENMEGCDGNEWIAYNRLISIADQLRGIAERMSDERS